MQVAGRADIEHLVAGPTEQIDPGCGRQLSARCVCDAVRGRHPGWRPATPTGCAPPANPAVRTARARRRRSPWHRSGPGDPARPWHRAGWRAQTAGRWAPRRGKHLAGQPHGVHHRRPRPGKPAARRRPSGIRRRTARCGRPARVPRMNSRKDGSTAPICGASYDHRIADPGQDGDLRRDRPARIDQGGEFAEHLTAPDLDRADLGDRLGLRGTAGGFQVHHHEGDLAQRLTELVEAVLTLGPRPDDGSSACCGSNPLSGRVSRNSGMVVTVEHRYDSPGVRRAGRVVGLSG